MIKNQQYYFLFLLKACNSERKEFFNFLLPKPWRFLIFAG